MTKERVSIDEFIKSLTRFSWAMSLFGVNQLANTFLSSCLGQPTNKSRNVIAAMDAITDATQEEFNEASKLAFRAGEQLQISMVDVMYSAFTFDESTSRYATKLVFDLMQQSAEAFRLFIPEGESRLALQEFKNKLQAYSLFEYVDGLLLSVVHRSLTKMVERMTSLEPFHSVWAMEGVGHYYTESVWMRKDVPCHLLSSEVVATLPKRSLIPLHAGMGLSLASHVLATIRPEDGTDKMRQAIRWFILLCQNNSRDGYVGVAYEALGLVARNLYPQMIVYIDQLLMEISEDLAGYFWHGVGRAIYFAPTNFAPCVELSQRAVDKVHQEPPHILAKKNALAGLAWAVALVNIRQPQILELILRRVVKNRLDYDAFTNGVSSALIVWREAAPTDMDLKAFCDYSPSTSDSGMTVLWDRLVGEPCNQAIRSYDTIKTDGRFGDLFRYQSKRQVIR